MTERLSGRPWQRIRWEVMSRDQFTCKYCGVLTGPDAEIDHVIPLSKGGTNELDNLVTACRPCNQAKRDGKAKGCRLDGTPMAGWE